MNIKFNLYHDLVFNTSHLIITTIKLIRKLELKQELKKLKIKFKFLKHMIHGL